MVDIFDILGPIMVGPSSSHTAGAARIGAMARTLLGSRPVKAEIGLHGSFAETGPGHGTDRALVAGILGMKPDDLRIPRSFEAAAEEGLRFHFHEVRLQEDVGFTGDYNTLIIHSLDISGELANVTREISRAKINIANMSLYRSRRGGAVLMVIETDQVVPPVVRELINELPGVAQVTCYEKGED